MTWLDEAVDLLSHGDHAECQLGHESHRFSLVPVDLRKSHLHVPDFPEIKDEITFHMPAGTQATLNLTEPGYCPERGEVSRSIRAQGTWEGFDTALVVQILRNRPGLVIDFGANLGWYTYIAGRLGHHVLSVEADAVIAEQLTNGINYNEIENWWLARGWIGPDTPELPVEGAPHVALIKSDMEGAEPEMFRVCDQLLEDGLVDYVLFELTPGWADYEPSVERVKSYGYELYIVPDKGYNTASFSQDPLACTKRQPLLHPVSKIGPGIQLMGLFVRKDLV